MSSSTSSSAPLFPPTILPADITSTLPAGFTLRPLEKADYQRGYLDCLTVLTWVGDLSEAEWSERYEEMAAAKGTYYLLAIEHAGRIVGTGSLVVERKLCPNGASLHSALSCLQEQSMVEPGIDVYSIHGRGLVGHVEEISVAKEHQGKGLGLKMIQALDGVGRNVGCYKNILNCGAKNEPFYVRCGYHNSGTEMSHYFEQDKDDFHRG